MPYTASNSGLGASRMQSERSPQSMISFAAGVNPFDRPTAAGSPRPAYIDLAPHCRIIRSDMTDRVMQDLIRQG